MRDERSTMGMPAAVDVGAEAGGKELRDRIYAFFDAVDARFSTYRPDSEVSRLNRGEITESAFSDELKEVLRLCEETKQETDGYFDIRRPEGGIDPSGLVKGWALQKAAQFAEDAGVSDFYIEIAGDMQTAGMDVEGKPWSIGIEHPFEKGCVAKIIYPHGRGVATSGSIARGAHIYDPHTGTAAPGDLISLTVVGPNVYEADRFATAAYAMGMQGVSFLEERAGFEAFAITQEGRAYLTSGFDNFTRP